MHRVGQRLEQRGRTQGVEFLDERGMGLRGNVRRVDAASINVGTRVTVGD